MIKIKDIQKNIKKTGGFMDLSLNTPYHNELNNILNGSKYNKKKKCLITYYLYLGLSPELIIQYIKPKMKADQIFRILELLFWDKEPYTVTKFVIENIENCDDFAFPSIFADGLILKENMMRYINLFKNTPVEKREMLFMMYPYFNEIDSDEQVLKILKGNTIHELLQMFKMYILSINYQGFQAYNGCDKRAMALYWGVINKHVERDRMNKFIKLEHTEDQIDVIIRALIHIDDDSIMSLISDPRNTPFDMDHLMKFYINHSSHKLIPSTIEK